MSRDIRTERKGAVYRVTNYCYQDELRLSPDPYVNLLVRSTLIRAAQRTGVVIIVAMVLGNHFDLVVDVPYDNVHKGMEEFQKELSHRLNRMRGTKHSNFPVRYLKAEIIDADAIEETIARVLCNPVRARLVARVDEWPGVSTLEAHRNADPVLESPLPTRRQAEQLPERGLDEEWLETMEHVRTRLGRPPMWRDWSEEEVHARICELVDAEEARLRDEIERKNEGVIGPNRIRKESWRKRPDNVGRRPHRRCISSCPKREDTYNAWYRETERAYKRAANRWRTSGKWGDYPPGTFPPGWLRCLQSSAEVGPGLAWMTSRSAA